MKIGILPKNSGNIITGIGRVTIGTLEELLELDKENEYCLLGKAQWLRLPMDAISMPIASDCEIPLDFVINAHPMDIVHTHYRPFKMSDSIKCAKVMTIHDIIPYVHPEWCKEYLYQYFDKLIRRSAQKADCIIAMSEHTKRDIVHYYGIDDKKIKVVYSGLYKSADELCIQEKKINKLEGEEYLLSVSAIDKHKNQMGLIKAFIFFKETHPKCGLKLVLTGPIRNAEGVKEELGRYPRIAEDVIFTGYVSDAELNWLYHNALAFIYVSFYEGFGLPILEALSKGKAVICSNVTSMPEVGGDAVEYCNPYEVDTIVQAMDNVLLDDARRTELESRSLVQAAKFSYRKAAEQTLAVYKMFE